MNCQLRMLDQSHLYRHIESNAQLAKRMLRGQPGRGKTVAICGAGPSLADTRPGFAHEVWACNSALPYLKDSGQRVTHGFCIDQGADMLGAREWARTFAVRYYLSSSVHPALTEHLLRAQRDVAFFHSFLGIPDPDGWDAKREGSTYEMWLYVHRFRDSLQVGHGLNSVPRAVCLAIALGFAKINVYGADCACAPDGLPMPALDSPEYPDWLSTLVMYADGRSPIGFGADAVMAEAVIDGRRWHTRPDMVISARHLLDLTRQYPHISLFGDTLPNALAEQDADFTSRLPSLERDGLVTGFGNAALTTSG